MSEVAAILHHATPSSLVLLDEVGRGTSTFDGLSIAWAVVEHLQKHTLAITCIATHYHELTVLADLLPVVKNVHVSVKETPSEIIFLRRVEPGSADKSYGIEVARLAGLPRSVIERAREVLKRHEQSEHQVSEALSPGALAETELAAQAAAATAGAVGAQHAAPLLGTNSPMSAVSGNCHPDPGAASSQREAEGPAFPPNNAQSTPRGASPRRAQQQVLFTPLDRAVLEKLREADLDRLAPLDALNLLAQLKKQIT